MTERDSRYELGAKLGEGGGGEVYRALDTRLGRFVALKFFPSELMARPNAEERVDREARSAAALNHPGIATIFDKGELDGRTFIAMELVEGETLHGRIRTNPPTTQQALEWCVQVCDAVMDAHSHGILHRDIKTMNIMITRRNETKILDFGLAKTDPTLTTNIGAPDATIAYEKSLTDTGAIVGTVDYLAPERLQGKPADVRSDIFSLGVVIYEAVTARRPFGGDTPAAVMNAILNDEPQPLQRYATNVPDRLEEIVRKALAKDPDDRYQTARGLLADLRSVKRSLDTKALLERAARDPSSGTTQFEALRATGVLDAAELGSEELVPIAETPPLPSRPALLAWIVAGVLAVAACQIFPPASFRDLENVRLSARDAEGVAREVLTGTGVSTFGYRSFTDVQEDDDVHRYLAYERTGPQERARIERWRPRSHYRCIFASADHLERYRFDVRTDGGLLEVLHDLRPDHVAAPVEPDSSSALARAILESRFGLDLNGFEPVAMAEAGRHAAGRRRQFRWDHRELDPLRADVTMVEGDLQNARFDFEIPPTVTASLEQRREVTAVVIWILFLALVVFAVFRALRDRVRYAVALKPRFLLVAAVVSFLAMTADNWRGFQRAVVEEGAWEVIGDFIGTGVGSVFIALIVWILAMILIPVIRRDAPDLIPGLARMSDYRASWATVARSALVGLPVGAILVAVEVFLPAPFVSAGTAYRLEPPLTDTPMGLVLEAISTILMFFGPVSILFIAGLAVFAVLRPDRIGWIGWTLVILFVTMMEQGLATDLDLQPAPLRFAVTFIQIALLIWVLARHGLVSGLMTVASWGLLEDVPKLAPAGLTSLQLTGLGFAVAWAIFLVAAFLRTRSAPGS